MERNKIIVNGETLIDLTQDTVSADKVLKDVTFHLPDGSAGVGTYEDGGGGGGEEFVPVKDGNTHVWITIPEDVPENQKEFELQLTASEDGGTVIDWGDDNTTTTSGTTVATYSHTYTNSGEYHIILTSSSGTIALGGTSGSSSTITGATFWNKYRINAAEIGTNVASLTNYCFSTAYSLKSVYFQANPSSIGTDCFYNCSDLIYVKLPDDMTSLPQEIFYGCKSLKQLTFPSNLQTIEKKALGSCGFSTLNLPTSITTLGESPFSGCPLTESPNIENVTTFGRAVFSNLSVTHLEFPNNMSTIPEYCCSGCNFLYDVVIGNNITAMEKNAFENCKSLATLTIPASITSLPVYAFSNCSELREIHFLSTTPPTLDAGPAAYNSPFNGLPTDYKIYVPETSVSTYKAASNWSTIAARIFAEPTT